MSTLTVKQITYHLSAVYIASLTRCWPPFCCWPCRSPRLGSDSACHFPYFSQWIAVPRFLSSVEFYLWCPCRFSKRLRWWSWVLLGQQRSPCLKVGFDGWLWRWLCRRRCRCSRRTLTDRNFELGGRGQNGGIGWRIKDREKESARERE